jgi:hypothetical protein
MRVMLMSGYPDGDMLFLNHGWHFIEKPFLAAQLVARVNDVLHTPVSTQGEDRFDTRIKPKSQGRAPEMSQGPEIKGYERRTS